MRNIIGLCYGILLTASVASSVEAGVVRHVNRTDAGCGGHSPCYTSIQAAVNAAQAGETVQIHAGSYVEQQLLTLDGEVDADRLAAAATRLLPLYPNLAAGITRE